MPGRHVWVVLAEGARGRVGRRAPRLLARRLVSPGVLRATGRADDALERMRVCTGDVRTWPGCLWKPAPSNMGRCGLRACLPGQRLLQDEKTAIASGVYV